MSSAQTDYWREAFECAAEDCGIQYTKDQANLMAESLRVSFDCYGMAFPPPSPGSPAPNPQQEIDRLSSELKECKRQLSVADGFIYNKVISKLPDRPYMYNYTKDGRIERGG